MKSLVRAASFGLLLLVFAAGNARASVIIAGTRVVFPAAQGDVTVRLSNTGERPALVEAWIDRGNPKATPDTARSPFLITPPLFRIDAGRDQSLRILFTGDAQALPSDRESLYWLNVLEIPPKPKNAAAKNLLRFAIRSRLKLFYRPADLAGKVFDAPEKLRFKAVNDAGEVALIVHNPTPYFVTLSKVALTLDGKSVDAATGMVAPFAKLTLALKSLAEVPAAGTPIRYSNINDYGAIDTHEGVITQ